MLKKFVHTQAVAYCFWGASTTAVNILVYMGLKYVIDYRSANLAAIIIGKVYAYVVNKRFVFKSICTNWKMLFGEVFAYIVSRGFTGAIDFIGVMILVEWMDLGQNVAKIFMTGIIIVINYFLGKKFVFLNRSKGSEDGVSFRKL